MGMSSLDVQTIENVATVKSNSSAPPAFQNSSGTQIGTLCLAWVNFNGNTGEIRASFNVTSVTNSSTGAYLITFTNPLPDADYVPLAGVMTDSSSWGCVTRSSSGGTTSAPDVKTTTQFQFFLVSNNPTTPAPTGTVDVNIAFYR